MGDEECNQAAMATVQCQIPLPEAMDCSGLDLVTSWKVFLENFEMYKLATDLKNVDEIKRIMTMKIAMGKDCEIG
jgi:hypothetical protein